MRVTGRKRRMTYKEMSIEANVRLNLGFNIANYKDFDWSGTGEDFVRDRHNETLVPFRYQDPFLAVDVRMYFGSCFQLESGISVNNNSHHLYEST